MARLAVAVLTAALLLSGPQDPVPDPKLLHEAKQLSLPTEHHTRLQRLLGDWEVSVRTPVAGGEPREERGRMNAGAILGGRFLVLNFVLELQGAKVEGVQILGFDTLHQLYTASWRDDLSTWSVECSGPPSAEAPDVLVLTGTLADVRDPTGRPFKLVLDLSKERAVTMRTFATAGGTDVELQSQQWTKK